MEGLANVLDGISSLAWPLLVGIILWKLFPTLQLMIPTIKDMIKSRGFTIKVGQAEITFQDASDQLRAQIEDLKIKVAELREWQRQTESGDIAQKLGKEEENEKAISSILWVDDKPSNNAYEVATFEDQGIKVKQVLSTTEAMRELMSGRENYDVIISDMGRREEGEYRGSAGILLIEQVRKNNMKLPIYIYSSARDLDKNKKETLEVGGNGATASPVELFELVKSQTAQSIPETTVNIDKEQNKK